MFTLAEPNRDIEIKIVLTRFIFSYFFKTNRFCIFQHAVIFMRDDTIRNCFASLSNFI